MRILHTSDWHLGCSLYGLKRYEEFTAFLDWLTQTIEEEKVFDQFGNRNSMHYRDITDKAMDQVWLNTSGKTPEAIKEANQPDKTPVGLMNGEQLVTLLMEYNIGVRLMSHDLFELEELPIEKGDV